MLLNSLTISVSGESGWLTFVVVAGGEAPLSYQWRKEGRNIGGATNAIFVLTHVQIADAGFYSLHVTNLWNSVTSGPAHLVVKMMPPGHIRPPNLGSNAVPSAPKRLRIVSVGNTT